MYSVSASIKVFGCVLRVTQGFGCVTKVASAEIVCRRSNFVDAAGRWEDEEIGGTGEFWFSTVLGLERPTSPLSAFVHYFIHLLKWTNKNLGARDGPRSFLVSPFGDAGCSATPCRAL